ncbi:MAG TPA: transposase [Bacteroidales bacterium]|nr:transposase [Bacteroidales bacterium]
MLKNGKRIRRRRVFTEDFKLKIVKSYESGEYSVPELEKIYDINNMSIYKWIYRYSNYNEKNVKVVEMKDSQYKKIKDLEERNKELERALGQKQMSLDYLEKMIELAKERYNIDIKKNSNTPQSGGSKTTKKN